jgi:hypothetical protein
MCSISTFSRPIKLEGGEKVNNLPEKAGDESTTENGETLTEFQFLNDVEILGKDAFLKIGLYDELFAIKNRIERSEKKYALSLRAKQLKVKTQFDNTVAELEREERKREKEERRKMAAVTVENITNFCEDSTGKIYRELVCGSWIATEEGVYLQGDGGVEKIACYHPILPIRRLQDIETGEEQITLAFKRDNFWKEITVPKTEVATAKSITSLARFGVLVNSETARYLVRFLTDVEAWNSDIIEIQHSTSKLGWHNDFKTFVPYDLDISFDGEYRFRSLYNSISEEGDIYTWIQCMKGLRTSGKIEPRIALAASFASVLIKPLGALPFIVDFHGQTGGGKTVTLMIAASVWASPETGAYIGNFRATDTSLETRADMLNNLPLILDDSKNAHPYIKDNYENLIYNLCNGKGKSRSNKDLGSARENAWSNVIICNGENPISEYAESGGAINRILEVECDEDIYENPSEICDLILHNHGLAGSVFIDEVKKIPIEDLKRMRKDIEDQFDKDKIMQKQLLSISILLLADKLATKYIFMDDMALAVDDVKDIPFQKNEITEGQRCYDYVLDSLSTYSQHFDPQFVVDQWGLPKERDADGATWACFYPQSFTEILAKKH